MQGNLAAPPTSTHQQLSSEPDSHLMARCPAGPPAGLLQHVRKASSDSPARASGSADEGQYFAGSSSMLHSSQPAGLSDTGQARSRTPAFQPPPQWEWAESSSGADLGLTALFNDDSASELVEEVVHLDGWRGIRVLGAPGELRNTLCHTGLLTWEGSRTLARLILAAPALFSGVAVQQLPSAIDDIQSPQLGGA